MFPPLENNNGEGASQQDTEAAGRGTEACMTPNADNSISVPATTLETPSDIARSQEASVSGEESKDNNNAIDTPRKHPDHTPTSFLESKLEELQTRLAQLESQAEAERHEIQVLERMVMEGSLPIPALSITHSIDQINMMRQVPLPELKWALGRFGDMEDLFKSYDGEDHMRFKGSSRGYLSRAISVFERELQSLHKEKDQEDVLLRERVELKRMQVTWDEEKEKLLQRQHELEQLCRNMRRGSGININTIDESDTDSQQQLAHSEEDVSSSSPAVNEIPELKYLDWHDYNKRQLFDVEGVGIPGTSPQRYAIDILEGEPVITWERPNIGSFGFGRNKRTSLYPTIIDLDKVAKLRKPAGNIKSSHIQGQAPLPERIRINSMHIVKILAKIRGDSEGLDHTPLVMIRPYKALAYYDEAIQSEFRKLQAKFGENYAAADDVSTAEGKESKTGEDDWVESDVTAKSEVKRKTDMPTDSSVEKETDSEGSEHDEEEEFTSSVTAYQHLSCLVQFMDKHLRNKIKYLARDPGYPGCQTVSFGEIWHLFQPGDEVIEQSRRQVYRIISISSAPHRRFSPFLAPGSWLDKEDREQEATPVVLCCVYVDFDGMRLGPKTRKVRIARFDGEKAVTELEVYPLSFAETGRKLADGQLEGTQKVKQSAGGPPTLREKLIARGRMFLDVTAIKHMHYSGLTVDTREEVDGDVVVDFEQAFSHDKMNNAKSLSTKEDADDTLHQHVSDTEKPDWQPSLRNLLGKSLEEEFDDADCGAPCCNAPGAESETIYKDAYAEEKRNADYMSLLMPEDRRREPPPTIYPRLLSEIKAQEHALTEDDLLIMSYRVFGFILRNRKWAQLDLDHLTLPESAVQDQNFAKEETNKVELEPGAGAVRMGSSEAVDASQADGTVLGKKNKDQTAFNQLVLPDGHKNMVRSLVAQHFRDKDSARKGSKETRQVDIVRGKGKGLIILLHGAPGVGKTSTAEGVAELFKKPLFQITCGDLGTSASEVETALETHFALANRWGCVLLLDEADVFLAARSKVDFIRNGLVSVFLRVLEYYEGILFLTTNRVGDFDEAFASRIHISLYYPKLDWEKTKAILLLNLELIKRRFDGEGRKIIVDSEILDYAEEYFNTHEHQRLNGRQIRNACQTALALAEYRVGPNAEVTLKKEYLETVSTAYLDFMHYLDKTRDQDVERWAKGAHIRARERDLLFHATVAREKAEQVIKEEQKYQEFPTMSATMTPQPRAGGSPLPPPAPSGAPRIVPDVAPGLPAGYLPQGAVLGAPQTYPPPVTYNYPSSAPGYPPTQWTPELFALYQQQQQQQRNNTQVPSPGQYSWPTN